MSYLFIDSTYDLTLGVLEDELKWLSFEKVSGQKVSVVLQSKVHELLKKHEIKAQELTGIIIVNGPGFYTGLRLSEGLSDVFQFFNVPSFAFYTYEIPAWCGIKSGTWFTKAYRGEYFLYHWDENGTRTELLSLKELPEVLPKHKQVYIHSESSLDDLSRGLIAEAISTNELLKNNPKDIFQSVIDGKLKREAFYFRAPEDEFKANP